MIRILKDNRAIEFLFCGSFFSNGGRVRHIAPACVLPRPEVRAAVYVWERLARSIDLQVPRRPKCKGPRISPEPFLILLGRAGFVHVTKGGPSVRQLALTVISIDF